MSAVDRVFGFLAAAGARTGVTIVNPHNVDDPHVMRELIRESLDESFSIDDLRAREIAARAVDVAALVRTIGSGPAAPGTFARVERWPGAVALGDAFARFARHDRLLVAVPFAAGPLAALVTALHRGPKRRFLIEETALSARFFAAARAALGPQRVALMTQGALVHAARSGEAAWFVTFPEHHRAPNDLTVSRRFLGTQHAVPLLEPLLFARGVAPLVTLSASADGAAAVARAAEHAAGASYTERAALEAIVTAVLDDVQTFIAAFPSTVLSWLAIRERSDAAAALRGSLEGRAVQGYLRAWRAAVADPSTAAALGAILALPAWDEATVA